MPLQIVVRIFWKKYISDLWCDYLFDLPSLRQRREYRNVGTPPNCKRHRYHHQHQWQTTTHDGAFAPAAQFRVERCRAMIYVVNLHSLISVDSDFIFSQRTCSNNILFLLLRLVVCARRRVSANNVCLGLCPSSSNFATTSQLIQYRHRRRRHLRQRPAVVCAREVVNSSGSP